MHRGQRVHGGHRHRRPAAVPRWLLALLLSAAAALAPSSALAGTGPVLRVATSTPSSAATLAGGSGTPDAVRPDRERPGSPAPDQLSGPRPVAPGGAHAHADALPASAVAALVVLALLGAVAAGTRRRPGRATTAYRGRGPPADRVLLAI